MEGGLESNDPSVPIKEADYDMMVLMLIRVRCTMCFDPQRDAVRP